MRRAMLAAIVLLFTIVGPAAAAVPNDTVAGAIAVSIGTTVTENTTTSDTTDAAETALNANCGAPVVEHGVWFKITPAADATVKFDTTDADYAAGIMIFAGAPTATGLLNCGPEVIIQDLSGGVEYTVMVFGDGGTAATSGILIFKVLEGVPAPEMSLTINRSGTVDKQGVAHISGTVTCTSTDGSGVVFEVFGDLTQNVGRFRVRGFFGTFLGLPCDGSTNAWDAFVVGENGRFAGGKAATVAISFGCTDVCSEAFAQATIQLRRSR